MDKLTEKSLKFIDAQFGAVQAFAKEKLGDHFRTKPIPDSDTWTSMPYNGGKDFIDLNIWEDDEVEGLWRVSAYPMQNIPDGSEGVQTDCTLHIPILIWEGGIFYNAEKSKDLTNALNEV